MRGIGAYAVLGILALAPSAGAAPAAPSREYWVSCSGGDDHSPGSADRPFRTVGRAQARVRRDLADGFGGDVTVTLRPGHYYLTSPLTFDERDSGPAGHSVTYRGVPPGHAEIIGGEPVAGWRAVDEHVYAAPVRKGRRFNALTENGRPATLARTPDSGYLAVESAAPDPAKARLTWREGDLPARFGTAGLQVLVWAGYDEKWDGGKNYNWEETLAPVADVDLATRTLTLAGPTIRKLHAHNRYYLRGARGFLDSPGEFWLDEAEGLLYYWPMHTPIERQDIVAATVSRAVEVVGSSPTSLAANITFDGLDISLSNSPEAFGPSMYLACDGLVYVANARNVTVRNCYLHNSGLAAIALAKTAVGHAVEANRIADCAYSGVCASGYWIGAAPFRDEEAAFVNRGHSIKRNSIRRCGQLIGQASGVWLYQSGQNTISQNRIEDMPRYGIRVEGTAFGAMVAPKAKGGLGGSLFGRPITWQNCKDFIYTRDNRIVDNKLIGCMGDSQDGGAICAYGTGTGNVVERNLVHDMRSTVTEGSIAGIYLDDAASGFTVRANVVAGMRATRYIYPLIVKGRDNTVESNIIADNDATAAIYILETPNGGLPPEEGAAVESVGNLSFRHNTIYRSGGCVYQVYPWRTDIIAESDNDAICEPTKPIGCIVDWKWEPWPEWRKRLGGKFDQHVVLADPLFVDPEHMNFALRPDSPVLRGKATRGGQGR
jgi:hypothetical protein